jgi:pimeloyl-ACP methyl ester carboxylesterase
VSESNGGGGDASLVECSQIFSTGCKVFCAYTAPMKTFVAFLAFCMAAVSTSAQELVSFPTDDGGLVYSVIYGEGERAVVLAHGGRFDKESWDEQGRALAKAGFRVLAFDFRGHGKSRGPATAAGPDHGRHRDVLAAVQYLRTGGARMVSVIGASMGGDYAAEAAEAEPKAIDRLVLIAGGAYTPLQRMTGPKLFIISRHDVIGDNQPRLPAIRAQYERASAPKEFVVLEGSAHAQGIYATSERDRLMSEILRFLSAP